MVRLVLAAVRRGPAIPPVILFYDDCCGFCMWTVAFVLRADRNGVVRTRAIQSPEGESRLGDLAPGVRLASWRMVDARGARWSGGGVFAPLAEQLPRFARLAVWIARVPRLTNLGYRAIASQRVRLSTLVPDASKDRARAAVKAHSGVEPTAL